MKRYVFITPDSAAYLPATDSPEPDFEDMRLVEFGRGQLLEDALRDILELNENMEASRPDETFHLDFHNEHRKFFRLREYRATTRIAS